MNFFDDITCYENNIAMTDENGLEVTYGKLVENTAQLTKNLPPRSLAFLVCENCPESVTAYIGFLRRRIVVALINPKIDRELFSRLQEAYRPQYLFCPEGWYDRGEELSALGGHRLFRLPDGEDVPMNPELAVLIATSGSTGSPKLVMQSYQNITSNANAIAEYLEITSEERAITTMPMHYTYGLSIIQSHLLKGARIITTEHSLMEKGFWNLLKTQKATSFGGVPYIYEMLKRLRFERMELPSLRTITQAGGKLSKELAEEFAEICEKKGIRFVVMYGQTEATARMAYLPWEYARIKAGSIGIAIPGGDLSLMDTNRNVIDTAGTEGELVYRGENVTLGYALNRCDLAKDDQWHGVLHTGDMAKRDADGFYYIVGRLKRFLKLFGNRVNLDEIEQLLRREGFTCACGGRDDLLTIYLENGGDETAKLAVNLISAKTGLNRSGFRAVAVPSLPRSEAGKVLYGELERQYG